MPLEEAIQNRAVDIVLGPIWATSPHVAFVRSRFPGHRFEFVFPPRLRYKPVHSFEAGLQLVTPDELEAIPEQHAAYSRVVLVAFTGEHGTPYLVPCNWIGINHQGHAQVRVITDEIEALATTHAGFPGARGIYTFPNRESVPNMFVPTEATIIPSKELLPHRFR